MERSAKEREALDATVTKSTRVIANIQAQLRDSEIVMSNLQAKLKESEREVVRKNKANKELEDELIMFKKEVMEQHEKGFFKAMRQAELFIEGLDLNLLDPFKDEKDGQLFDEDEIAAMEESDGGEKDDGADVQAMLLLVVCYVAFVASSTL